MRRQPRHAVELEAEPAHQLQVRSVLRLGLSRPEPADRLLRRAALPDSKAVAQQPELVRDHDQPGRPGRAGSRAGLQVQSCTGAQLGQPVLRQVLPSHWPSMPGCRLLPGLDCQQACRLAQHGRAGAAGRSAGGADLRVVGRAAVQVLRSGQPGQLLRPAEPEGRAEPRRLRRPSHHVPVQQRRARPAAVHQPGPEQLQVPERPDLPACHWRVGWFFGGAACCAARQAAGRAGLLRCVLSVQSCLLVTFEAALCAGLVGGAVCCGAGSAGCRPARRADDSPDDEGRANQRPASCLLAVRCFLT